MRKVGKYKVGYIKFISKLPYDEISNDFLKIKTGYDKDGDLCYYIHGFFNGFCARPILIHSRDIFLLDSIQHCHLEKIKKVNRKRYKFKDFKIPKNLYIYKAVIYKITEY